MEEPLIVRGEVTSMLFAILDISENTERITKLLEEELGGEDSEEDT
jgi:hypothetical protein